MKKSAKRSQSRLVTNILNEPIAEDGLGVKFEIKAPGGPVFPTSLVQGEALGPREAIEQFAAHAAKLAKRLPKPNGNVYDLKARAWSEPPTLTMDVYYDAAVGRPDTGYAIFDVSGPSAQVEQIRKELAVFPAFAKAALAATPRSAGNVVSFPRVREGVL
jgi:hypothetical protein